MSRLHRIDVPGLPQHVVVRGNNRADCFVDDFDRWAFLKYLVDATLQRDCDLHAYVLMTNHVHLLATGKVEGALSLTMQDALRRYVLDAIRASLAKNRVLGGERFIAELGFSLDRQVGIRSRGRPRKRGQEKMSPDPI